MKSHQFTSMISFTGSTWPALIISLSCSPLSFLLILSFSLHLSNLIFHSSHSHPHSLFSFLLYCPVCSLFYCTLQCLSFTLLSFFPFFLSSSTPLKFIFVSLSVSLCHLSIVCCSFLAFLLLSVAHRNPSGSLTIRAY